MKSSLMHTDRSEYRDAIAAFPDYNYVDTQRDLLVDALVQIYGDRCFYCPEKFVNEQDHKFSRTVDHYHSQDYCKKNGFSFEETHGLENLVLSHKLCNSNKSNREWLEDGTLAPRGRVRPVKKPRPEVCETCYSGRLLFIGENCPDCGSGPQPASAPKAYQVSPKECSHAGYEHCWLCFLGFVARKTPLESFTNGE